MKKKLWIYFCFDMIQQNLIVLISDFLACAILSPNEYSQQCILINFIQEIISFISLIRKSCLSAVCSLSRENALIIKAKI